MYIVFVEVPLLSFVCILFSLTLGWSCTILHWTQRKIKVKWRIKLNHSIFTELLKNWIQILFTAVMYSPEMLVNQIHQHCHVSTELLLFEYIIYSAIKSISFHQLIIKRKRDKHHDNHCNVHNILASDIKYK